jgi:hypothetical protein
MTEEKFLGVGFVKFYVYLFVILFLVFFVAFPLYNWLLAQYVNYFIVTHTAVNTTNSGYLIDGFRIIEELRP